ncbi:MAG: ZIP family metal transporter [Spirochaetaceae bacterium]|jgi:ZIP family zinc transporter|nr:ZIP family metal transporter [Spirochaetaceae bacterium]
MQTLIWTAAGTGFIFLMTCFGSAMVFFFHKEEKQSVQTIFLGFAAGVMVAASMFGLLAPAIEEAESRGLIGWIPASIGFLAGVFFLLAMDRLIPHFHPATNTREGLSSSMKRTTLLVSAVTLHNIPEGMAVGLSFARAAEHGDEGLFTAAMALALGIGIQNFPEGAAISLPLRREGFKTGKSFVIGCLSGITEPLFGILMVLIAAWTGPVMPWLLAFAAGAMMYVVVEELIPEARLAEHSGLGTIAVMTGFTLMMILDVALG